MTKDDILELVREARLGNVLCHNSVEGDRVWIEGADWHDELEQFAALLEAKVRKECAELCRAEANGRSPLAFDALHECADLIMEGYEK